MTTARARPGLAALLQLLAAAKTNLSETKQVDVVAGQVNVTPEGGDEPGFH